VLRSDISDFRRKFTRINGMTAFTNYSEDISHYMDYFQYIGDDELEMTFDYFTLSISLDNYIADMEEEIDRGVEDLGYPVRSAYIKEDIMCLLETATYIYGNEDRQADSVDIVNDINNPKIAEALVTSTTIGNFYKYLNSVLSGKNMLNGEGEYHLVTLGWARSGSLHMLLSICR